MNLTKIVSFEDYKELNDLPKTNDEIGQKLSIEKDIDLATNMIDDYCAGIFVEYNKIKNSDDPNDIFRVEKLKRAIIETAKIRNLTGGIWVDLSQQVSSNVSTSLNTTSTVSQLEINRQDIIRMLISGNWYKNIRTSGSFDDEFSKKDEEQFIAKLKTYFDNFYLSKNGGNSFDGLINPELNMKSSRIINTGDIISNWGNFDAEKKRLIGFDLIDGNASSATNADKIFDPTDMTYKFINQFDIHYFDGLNRQEIYEAIAASDKTIQNGIIYKKGWVGVGEKEKNVFAWYESLIDDNLNNLPIVDHQEAWRELPFDPIDMQLIFNYIDEKIAALEQTKINVEFLNEVKQFKDNNDYNAYKAAAGLTDEDFEDVEVPPSGATPEQTAQIENNKQEIEKLKQEQIKQNNEISDLKTKTETNKNDITQLNDKLNNAVSPNFLEGEILELFNVQIGQSKLYTKIDTSFLNGFPETFIFLFDYKNKNWKKSYLGQKLSLGTQRNVPFVFTINYDVNTGIFLEITPSVNQELIKLLTNNKSQIKVCGLK